MPSMPLEKYSILSWPCSWPSSGGRAATVSATRARMAATRLTIDSRASDNSPTEPVRKYDPPLRPIVITAAAIDSQANRVSAARAIDEAHS